MVTTYYVIKKYCLHLNSEGGRGPPQYFCPALPRKSIYGEKSLTWEKIEDFWEKKSHLPPKKWGFSEEKSLAPEKKLLAPQSQNTTSLPTTLLNYMWGSGSFTTILNLHFLSFYNSISPNEHVWRLFLGGERKEEGRPLAQDDIIANIHKHWSVVSSWGKALLPKSRSIST